MNETCVGVEPKFSLFQLIHWKIQSVKWFISVKSVNLALAFIRWMNRDSNYIKHANREFDIMYAGMSKEDLEGPNTWVRENMMDLLSVLGTQGHSGGSIGYCLEMFQCLAKFKCIAPLTGEDNEWIECGPGVWQNRRMSTVFKEADGKAYNIDGYVFRDPDGMYYTNGDSRKPIEFPWGYEPPIVVEVDAAGNLIEKGTIA